MDGCRYLRASVQRQRKMASHASSSGAGGSPGHAPSGGGGAGGGSGSGGPYHHHRSRFGDTTLTKVFVGGLAWETPSEGLRQHFEAYGEILEAVVITDRETGRSKGYGFVSRRRPPPLALLPHPVRPSCLPTDWAPPRALCMRAWSQIGPVCSLSPQVIFRDPDSAARAVQNPNPVIAGRRANCNIAAFGPPRPAQARGERPEEPNQINAPSLLRPLFFFPSLLLYFPLRSQGTRMCMAVITGASLAPAAVRGRFTG